MNALFKSVRYIFFSRKSAQFMIQEINHPWSQFKFYLSIFYFFLKLLNWTIRNVYRVNTVQCFEASDVLTSSPRRSLLVIGRPSDVTYFSILYPQLPSIKLIPILFFSPLSCDSVNPNWASWVLPGPPSQLLSLSLVFVGLTTKLHAILRLRFNA